MESKTKTLVDYETESGRSPIREWFEDLEIATLARVDARLKRVRMGNFGDFKSIGLGVNELRFNFGSGYRIYFAQHGEEIVLLLCGGDKSTQSNDIEQAKVYWSDFKRRNNA